jgi:hypothetical protein
VDNLNCYPCIYATLVGLPAPYHLKIGQTAQASGQYLVSFGVVDSTAKITWQTADPHGCVSTTTSGLVTAVGSKWETAGQIQAKSGAAYGFILISCDSL